MGAFLDKPKTEKHTENGAGNGLLYGLSSMQGWRVEMEDAHCAVANLQGDLKDWAFFAVFDGHAGARVSAHCSENLLHCITSSESFQESASAHQSHVSEGERLSNICKGIREGFLKLDESMRTMPEVASGEDKSGTTAVCSLISPTHIFVANCGDSRAVLYRRDGIEFSTQDHKPINPVEKERIQNAGGSVMIQRVNGSLAVSRALGDYEYKNVEGKGPCEQLVSPEPELYIGKRNDDDEFLILACDGVWDVMSNEDVCSFVHSRLLITHNAKAIANHIIDTCFYKGSRDNMSVVLVVLPGAPEISEEAVAQEKIMEERIEKKIAELCEKAESPLSLSFIMEELDNDNIPALPPGGGLISLRGFVESVYKKLKPEWAAADTNYNAPGDLVFLPSQAMHERLSSIIEGSFRDDNSDDVGESK